MSRTTLPETSKLSDRVVIVRCPDRAQIALPEWMLNSVACDRLPDEVRPRVAISALVALKRLLEPHRHQRSGIELDDREVRPD